MKIVTKIAEKILNHCSKCGGCPIAKLTDTQVETVDDTPSETQLSKENPKSQPLNREQPQPQPRLPF